MRGLTCVLRPQADYDTVGGVLGGLFTRRPVSPTDMHLLLQRRSWPSLTRSISLEEVVKVLTTAKPGSSPGPDGIPYKFYKFFPNLTTSNTPGS